MSQISYSEIYPQCADCQGLQLAQRRRDNAQVTIDQIVDEAHRFGSLDKEKRAKIMDSLSQAQSLLAALGPESPQRIELQQSVAAMNAELDAHDERMRQWSIAADNAIIAMEHAKSEQDKRMKGCAGT